MITQNVTEKEFMARIKELQLKYLQDQTNYRQNFKEELETFPTQMVFTIANTWTATILNYNKEYNYMVEQGIATSSAEMIVKMNKELRGL